MTVEQFARWEKLQQAIRDARNVEKVSSTF